MARSILLLCSLLFALAPLTIAQIVTEEVKPGTGAAWEGSVSAALAKARKDGRPVIWVVMIEREVACRRMMRRVWKNATVLAKAKNFVLIPCNPYPQEDLGLFEGVSARQVKANEAEFRTRFETRTEVVAPQHVITDAAGKVLVRKDYELDAKELGALMDRGLAKAGNKVVAADDKSDGSDVPPPPGVEDAPAEEEEEKPSEEALRLVQLIVKAPSDEKEDLTDELLDTANTAGVKALTDAILAKKIKSEKDRAAVVRRGGYEKHADHVKAYLPLINAKSTRVRNAAVVTLEEMKSSAAAKLLVERFKKERDPEIKKDILRALGTAGVGHQPARDLLVKYAKKKGKLSLNALMAIGPHIIGDAEIREVLKTAWKKTSKDYRLAILYSYWVARDPDTAEDLKWIKEREKRGTEYDLAESVLAVIEGRRPERGSGAGRGGRRGGRGGIGNLLGGQWRLMLAWRPLFEQDKVQRNAIKDIRDGLGGLGGGRGGRGR